VLAGLEAGEQVILDPDEALRLYKKQQG
jgi:hypothetical protein